jgi:hypothetical protein
VDRKLRWHPRSWIEHFDLAADYPALRPVIIGFRILSVMFAIGFSIVLALALVGSLVAGASDTTLVAALGLLIAVSVGWFSIWDLRRMRQKG